MSLALTTVSNGSVISAPDLRTYCSQVEDYVNQGIASADLLSTSWVESTHIYGPSFPGAPNPRGRFETGQTIYRQTGMDPLQEAIFHNRYNSGYVPVDRLCATFCVPETLDQGTSPKYDLLVEASFWCYSFGGINATVDEATDLAASFKLQMAGSNRDATQRNLYAGDAAAAVPYNGGIIYARKNHHMVARIQASSMAAGVYSVGVVVDVATNVDIRHIIVGGRTLRATWYVR